MSDMPEWVKCREQDLSFKLICSQIEKLLQKDISLHLYSIINLDKRISDRFFIQWFQPLLFKNFYEEKYFDLYCPIISNSSTAVHLLICKDLKNIINCIVIKITSLI